MEKVYLNRELSWLKFDERVLEEAEDESVPLFERLRFVYIFLNNLDEFYMVRVGSLYDQTLMDDPTLDTKTGMTPRQQLHRIFDRTRGLLPRKDAAYFAIMRQMGRHGLTQVDLENMSEQEKAYLEAYFEKEIMPLISPQIIDKHHPFPFLKNKELYVGVHLAGKNDAVKLGIIPASGSFDRVVFLPTKDIRFVLVEDLIRHFAGRIFGESKILDKTIFRITRNVDLSVEDTSFDFDFDYREAMTELIKKRKKLAAVRLELFSTINVHLMNYICDKLELDERQVFINSTPLDLSFVSRLEARLKSKEELFFPPLTPQKSPFVNPAEPIARQLAGRDILLHYPYNSMEPYIRLLEEAADDPQVVSVKITLYRVAKDSKIINALIRAAENGKEVKAVVELRARFDEENNIDWSKRLEEAGCDVIYGLDEYKVHSKLTLITRKIGSRIEYITQVGTGNYNEKTARLYTDLCLMTARREFGAEASMVFNSLYMGNPVETTNHLLVAPLCFKSRVIELIDGEIAAAKTGQMGAITLKMNSLSDRDLLDKLIEASQAGVRIRMLVRGICCMRPGIPGYTENIEIRSIVGRFLEHARIYVFGTEGREKVYIASADFMTRNTERRVEVGAPIYDEKIKKRLLDLLDAQFRDNVKARRELPNGDYIHISDDGEPYDSQLRFYELAYRLAGEQYYPVAKQGPLHRLWASISSRRKDRK